MSKFVSWFSRGPLSECKARMFSWPWQLDVAFQSQSFRVCSLSYCHIWFSFLTRLIATTLTDLRVRKVVSENQSSVTSLNLDSFICKIKISLPSRDLLRIKESRYEKQMIVITCLLRDFGEMRSGCESTLLIPNSGNCPPSGCHPQGLISLYPHIQ